VDAKEDDLLRIRREIDESNRALTKQKSKLQSLEELAAALEGYGDGPRSILEWAKENGKDETLRALADGWDISEGFEPALEGFLEGNLEALVTEDTASAMGALRALAEGNKGRASILIANLTSEARSSEMRSFEEALQESGFSVLGKLSQFVRPNSKLSETGGSAILRALDGAVVVEAMTPLADFLANQGDRRIPAGACIVARDGSALTSDGILRGGSVFSDNAASLLGRKK